MRPAGAGGPAAAVSLRCGPCARARVRYGNSPEPGAPCVQDPSDRLCPDTVLLPLCMGQQRGTPSGNAALSSRSNAATAPSPGGSGGFGWRRCSGRKHPSDSIQSLGLHTPRSKLRARACALFACPGGHFGHLAAPFAASSLLGCVYYTCMLWYFSTLGSAMIPDTTARFGVYYAGPASILAAIAAAGRRACRCYTTRGDTTRTQPDPRYTTSRGTINVGCDEALALRH